jgi:hypothetical protein
MYYQHPTKCCNHDHEVSVVDLRKTHVDIQAMDSFVWKTNEVKKSKENSEKLSLCILLLWQVPTIL